MFITDLNSKRVREETASAYTKPLWSCTNKMNLKKNQVVIYIWRQKKSVIIVIDLLFQHPHSKWKSQVLKNGASVGFASMTNYAERMVTFLVVRAVAEHYRCFSGFSSTAFCLMLSFCKNMLPACNFVIQQSQINQYTNKNLSNL